MLGMEKNMHLGQGKQAWNTTLLGKREMGGAQSPREQYPGMGVLNGGKHAYQGAKLCMHACMYEDKGHKGHVPCEKGPKATPQKQVKHGTLPPQGKNAAHLLSLILSK